MKKPLLFFLSLLFFNSTFIFAQIQDSGNHGLMTLTLIKKDLSKIKGTPYLEEKYQSGTFYSEGKEPLTAYMRYDVHNENIEIKTDLNSEEVFVLPIGKNSKYEIDSQTFLHDKLIINGQQIQGYFIEHYAGNNFRFLEKPQVVLTEPIVARTGYEKDRPAEIKIESEFYVKKEDGSMENIRLKHKDIKKSFTSKSANEYLSKNKIKSLDDLVNFLKHLDQVKN